MKYNIGEMLILEEDLELESCFGNKKLKKKGTKRFVSANKKMPGLLYLDGKIQLLPKDIEIEGYSVEGISEWLYIWLKNAFPLDEFFDDYEIGKEEFKDKIAEALEELGMYDNTGNRS